MIKCVLLFCLGFVCFTTPITAFCKLDPARDTLIAGANLAPVNKIYIGSALEGANFSTATMQRPGFSDNLGTLRFTYFINFGVTVNYDFSRHFGIYTGLDLKNIGFIEKRHDSTIKRRTYSIGIPVAIKIGDLKSRTFGLVGAGLDAPINYREKEFTSRGHKNKFTEWFSDRTPHLMPYVFAGLAIAPGISFKAQYYLNNYMNPAYTASGNGITVKPYDGYNIHLLLFSIGIIVPYSKPHIYDIRTGKKQPMQHDEVI